MLISCLIAAAPLLGATAADDAFALRASHVHVGDGQVVLDAFVVVEDGVVKSVSNNAPRGVRVVEVDGHIAPGFISLRETLGAGSENTERTRKSTPTADLSFAFDPTSPSWKGLVSEGVTTVLLPAGNSQIAGGQAAIVSPAAGEVLKRNAVVTLGLSRSALGSSTAPTSFAGLYAHLGEQFAAAPEGSPLAEAKAGKVPVMMRAVTRSEVHRALEFAAAHGLKGAVIGAPEADDLVDELKASGLAVVFESKAAPASSKDVVKSALALSKAEVPFAFTSDAGSQGPLGMRMQAAACMRAGLDAGAALRAMTADAARIAGVEATHGTIATGRAADLVVWSGPPTDLTSRVHSVYAGGHLVHSAHAHGAHQ